MTMHAEPRVSSLPSIAEVLAARNREARAALEQATEPAAERVVEPVASTLFGAAPEPTHTPSYERVAQATAPSYERVTQPSAPSYEPAAEPATTNYGAGSAAGPTTRPLTKPVVVPIVVESDDEASETSADTVPTLLRRRPLPRPVPPASAKSRPSEGGTGWPLRQQRFASDQLLHSLVQALNDAASARRYQARVLVEQNISSHELRMASLQLDAELIRLRAYVEALSALEDVG